MPPIVTSDAFFGFTLISKSYQAWPLVKSVEAIPLSASEGSVTVDQELPPLNERATEYNFPPDSINA